MGSGESPRVNLPLKRRMRARGKAAEARTSVARARKSSAEARTKPKAAGQDPCLASAASLRSGPA